MAYCKAYQLTGKSIYYGIAKATADYLLREMTSEEGGFYCAQDADSEGVEGKSIPNLLKQNSKEEWNETNSFDLFVSNRFQKKFDDCCYV